MKLVLTLVLTAMLVPAGALAQGSPDEQLDEPGFDPGDRVQAVFLTEVPRGAEKAKKDERAMGLKVDEIVGTSVVKQQTGEDIGKVKSVIVDSHNGETLGLVMHIDDLPGVDQRDIAVDRLAIDTTEDDDGRLLVEVDVDAHQLRNAPEFFGDIEF